MVESGCLSSLLTAAAAGVLLSATWAGDIDQSIAARCAVSRHACAVQQVPALSSSSSSSGATAQRPAANCAQQQIQAVSQRQLI